MAKRGKHGTASNQLAQCLSGTSCERSDLDRLRNATRLRLDSTYSTTYDTLRIDKLVTSNTTNCVSAVNTRYVFR